VGFAPRRDAEQLPEGACHAAIMLKNHGAVNSIAKRVGGTSYTSPKPVL
jgi:hypothetical protein